MVGRPPTDHLPTTFLRCSLFTITKKLCGILDFNLDILLPKTVMVCLFSFALLCFSCFNGVDYVAEQKVTHCECTAADMEW